MREGVREGANRAIKGVRESGADGKVLLIFSVIDLIVTRRNIRPNEVRR